MICPRCGSEISRKRGHCSKCGADIQVTWHLIRRSNLYYNDGLAKARVRDLSGAIVSLKKSLECNKYNIQARNLLGLVYFELGELAEALSNWIISKHYDPSDKLADAYIEKVSANSAKLDGMNQAIKKYNLALAAAKQGNNDLAVIQLRKVVGSRPGYVKALQLLALLYMNNGENEKAKRCLLRAQKVDVANTITLTYLAELEKNAPSDGKSAVSEEPKEESTMYRMNNNSVSLKEDKPNYVAFLTFFAGILIGIAVLYKLVVPTVRESVKTEFANTERDYNAEISGYTASISVLENEKADLAEKLEKAEKNVDKLKREIEEQEVFDAAAYENLMLTLAEFPEIEGKIEAAKNSDDLMLVLDELITYNDRLLTLESTATERTKTATYYHSVLDQVSEIVKAQGYDYGHELYNGKKYKEAIPYFEAAYRAGRDDADNLYFLGRSYQRTGDKEKAKTYLEMVVELYPKSDRAGMAKSLLEDLQ